jgi:Tfp pilus assembly protein PilF
VTAGEALEKKGFSAEAIRQYENARTQYPPARGAARHLAVLYDLQGEATRAETEYTQALKEQPRDAELLNDFGYFHYRHNHLQTAENWLRIAVMVNPNCQCAWVNLGQVLACQGRSDESFQAFSHVLRPAEAYSNLGVLLAKQGRTAEARRALEQALALEPGLQQPRAFLHALTGGAPRPLPPGITSNPPLAPTPIAKQPAPVAPLAPRFLETPRPALSVIPRPEWSQLPSRSNPSPAVLASSPAPTLWSRPRAAPVATNDLPAIVNGPIRPAAIAPGRLFPIPAPQQSPATPPTTNIVQKTPPAPPPPPPAPPRFAPPAPSNDEGPILIRTSAIEVQPAVSQKSSSPPKPLLLPSKLASTPLTQQAAPRQAPPSAPPRVVITDCQSDPETHGSQEP